MIKTQVFIGKYIEINKLVTSLYVDYFLYF